MPETDLEVLLSQMRPDRMPGRFVFVSSPDELPAGMDAWATVREPEGLSAVLSEEDAIGLDLPFDFVAGWITLRVESALAAVGLTAAVSAALTKAGISCNVVAGLHHDHLLVPIDRVEDALRELGELSAASGPRSLP